MDCISAGGARNDDPINARTMPCSLEDFCSQHLDHAICKHLSENKFTGESSVASVLQEHFFDSSFKQDSLGAIKFPTVKNYLKIVNGVLLVFGASSKRCLLATSSLYAFQKEDFVDHSLNDLIHEEDRSKFDVDSDSTDSERLCLFDCKLRKGDIVGAKQNNCEPVKYMMMKCIKFVEHVNKEMLADYQTEESRFIFCLATPAPSNTDDEVPPNQTISSRGKIPQPEKFCTRQDLSGELNAVGLTYDDLLTSKYRVPSHMKDVVEKCLRLFINQNHNGRSLKDILLQQVLSQGKASSRSTRIQLSEETMANWLIKSELYPRVPKPGEPQHIFSVHLIYRQGTWKGIQGLRDIIPVPPQTHTSNTKEDAVTMTTSSIATTTSYSTGSFLSTSHYPNQQMKTETFISDGRGGVSQWGQRPAARVNLDVSKDFLSGIPGNEQQIMESLNGVVSPPPHLDGPMVHTVGGPNPMMTSSSSSFQISPSPSGSGPGFVRPHTAGSGSSFLPPKSEPAMFNPVTFPGPPCVGLASCGIATKSELPLVSTTSVTSVFVDSASVNVTTTQDRVPMVNPVSSTTGLLNTPFSPPSTRTCPTPDKTGACQNSPPKRPRSASINTTPGGSGSLKRTASTLSEDSGIGELGSQCKRSPIQRSKSKDKPQDKNSLLKTLLTAKSSDEVSVSYTVGASKSPAISTATAQPTPNTTSLVSYNTTSSISNQINFGKIAPLGSPPFPQLANNRLARGSQATPQPTNPSAEISPYEREDLDEIFNCYESIIGSNPQQPTSGNAPPPPTNPTNPAAIRQPTMSNNFLPSARQDSLVNTTPSNLSPGMFRSLRPQNSLPSTQPLPAQALSSPQSLPGPPPYTSFAASPSSGSPALRRIVPTGQETCPNRVVGSGNILSPKAQQTPPTSQLHRDYPAQDNWAGHEPLVDLGAYPPPAGINPRMTIPSQSPMNQSILGASSGIKAPPNVNVTNHQVGVNRMAFRSSSMGMSGGTMHVNIPAHHLQNPTNNAISPSVSPRNYANNISPSGFPQTRSVNTPPYSGNMQQQTRFAANGNIRTRLLRQQPRPGTVQYRNEMVPTAMSGNPQYSYGKPELTRYLPPHRANGAMLRARKQSPVTQRPISSPVAQNVYNPMTPTPRFAANQAPTNQYSTLPPNQFANSTSFNNELSPSMNFDPAMRSSGVMPAQNSIQHPSPSFNTSMNNIGPVMGSSYLPGDQTALPGKPLLKRSRSKKNTRKKAGSTDEGSWVDEMTNTAYKQRPLMQMTIGNMHQRPQPTYNTSLDGALSSNPSMMSPQGGGVQNLNLNSLMSQNDPKMSNLVPGAPPVSFQTNSFHPSPPASWSGNNVSIPPSLGDGMFEMFNDPLQPQTTSYPLDAIGAVESNATMNSNINNNKTPDLSYRFTATATMLPGPPAPQLSEEKNGKGQKRPTKLLESLLLQKDE